MSRIRIVNPVDRDFGMVPRLLWQTDLPFAAKGAAAYLFCLRDGAVPYVAEIERDLGLGRDARRKAFAALEAAGVIRWHIERNARNVITGKTLELCAEALVLRRAPESQADGDIEPKSLRAPENPSGGKPTPAEVDFHPCSDGLSGDTLRERKKERAAAARSSAQRPRPVARSGGAGASLDVAKLTPFARSCIEAGQSVTVGGVLIQPGSPDAERLRAELRAQRC